MTYEQENSQDLQEEVTRLKEELAGKTALAWIGMAASVWMHSTLGNANTILGAAELIQLYLQGAETNEKINKYLELIQRRANDILEVPLLPPLSSEEGVTNVEVNDVLQERITQFLSFPKFENVNIVWQLEQNQSTSVKVSLDWLRYCLNFLIENALEAMISSPVKKLTISTYEKRGSIEVHLQDSGTGISPDIMPLLFKKPINNNNAKMGRGLLMASLIAEVYGGKIYVLTTSPEGSTFVLVLPMSK